MMPANLAYSRNVTLLPAAPMGPVQEIIPIAQGAFGVLINRDDDCLDMVIMPAFTGRQTPDFGQGFNPWRIAVFVAFDFRHQAQLRPPRTFPLVGLSSFLSLSRSAHHAGPTRHVIARDRSRKLIVQIMQLVAMCRFPRFAAGKHRGLVPIRDHCCPYFAVRLALLRYAFWGPY
jgi:hypothetical protein